MKIKQLLNRGMRKTKFIKDSQVDGSMNETRGYESVVQTARSFWRRDCYDGQQITGILLIVCLSEPKSRHQEQRAVCLLCIKRSYFIKCTAKINPSTLNLPQAGRKGIPVDPHEDATTAETMGNHSSNEIRNTTTFHRHAMIVDMQRIYGRKNKERKKQFPLISGSLERIKTTQFTKTLSAHFYISCCRLQKIPRKNKLQVSASYIYIIYI